MIGALDRPPVPERRGLADRRFSLESAFAGQRIPGNAGDDPRPEEILTKPGPVVLVGSSYAFCNKS